jgi:hypothetical protein
VISGSKPADPETSTTRAIPEKTGPSPMSRKKEPWMSELKSIYASNLSKRSPADLLVPYPKVGDTYKTVEGFKGACLLASWPAGHDMVLISLSLSFRWLFDANKLSIFAKSLDC